MKTTVTMTAALVLFVSIAGVVAAAEVDVTKLPGYVNLSEIKIPAGAETLQEIDLGPDLLAAAFKSDELTPGDARTMAEALEMVKSVRLISFAIAGESAVAARAQVDALQKKLEGGNWKRVVMMRDKEEYVVVSVLHGPSYIQGLMVMAVEPDEATFVNVVGELNLSTMAQLAGDLHSKEMEAVLKDLESGGGK
jgi:hypothetical protein